MIQRVLQNTAEVITHDFADETATPVVSGATVRVVRDDGTELLPTTAANLVDGTAATYGYQLTLDHTDVLDCLSAVWTATVDGVTQTFTETVEIVGGLLFTNAELRSISLGGTQTIGTRYTTQQINDMRVTVEDALEHAVGYSFVPRYERVRLSGWRSRNGLLLPPYTRTVRWVTVGGSPTATTLTYDGGRLLANPSGWVRGIGNIVAGIEHGLDRPPPRVRNAAKLLAKTWIVAGPVDDRVTTVSSPDTGITSVLSVPGRGGSNTGVPEVDQVIREHRMPVVA